MSIPIRRRHNPRKRKGFIVKGVTKRHWWDACDKDTPGNSRQLVKRDLRHQMKAWGME